MKSISNAFLTMLQTSQQLVKADLYTFTLGNGTVLRYTSAQQAIVHNGNTYLAAFLDSAPGFRRGNTSCSIGLNVDTLEVDILYDAATRINGLTPGAFVQAGGFDNAMLEVDVALAPNWTNPVANGVVNLFTGIVSDITADAGMVKLNVSSQLIRLGTSFPRNYLLPQCNNALFDTVCALNAATYAVNGTVSGTGTLTTFNSNLTQADSYFALGRVVWLTGANAGLTSRVKAYAHASGAFTITYPLAQAPANGDTFTAYPGCDKTRGTNGCAKFNNLIHFRGFPYVPTPETLELGSQGAPPAQSGGGGGGGMGSLGRGGGGASTTFKQR